MQIGMLCVAVALTLHASSLPRSIEYRSQPGDAAMIARSIGLSPAVLAVSGVTGAEVASVFGRIDQSTNLQAQLASLRSQVQSLTNQVGQTRKQLRRDPANGELIAQLRNAKLQLRTAASAIGSAQAAVASAAATSLSNPVAQRLAMARAIRQHEVPAEFKCVERTPREWRLLEADLMVERRAVRSQRSVPVEVASRLAAERARPEVAAARQAIGSQLLAIQAQFGPS
jgi:hypothetical protein